MKKKATLKVTDTGFINILELVHIYGKKRLKTIKLYKVAKLPDGDLFVQFYDKRGKLVKPRHFPKIGRKSNMSKKLRDIANGR
jgi:hypothetical protein